MSERRDRIVARVMHALGSDTDPTALVHAHFDEDRQAVLEATRQTLEATNESTDPARVEEVVDRELTEALRFPSPAPGGTLEILYVRRWAFLATAGTVAAMVALVLLMLL